jgi:uncharacterized protein (DUF58 family)
MAGWRRFFARRTQMPRRLKFTREGKFFVGITLGVGFAAINTGNNLLYLLLGMLLALIVVSGILSEISLQQLTVVRKLPHRAQVGRPHVVEVEVFNHKPRIPSYAIEVEDLRAGQPADKRCFFLKISPGSAQVAAYRRTPQKRGRDEHIGFRLATRFPFGLFEKSREILLDGSLIIYPQTEDVPPNAPPRGDREGERVAIRRGYGDEFLALKPHRSGEDLRDVHWRKSATVGQLVLRERAEDQKPEVRLTLDVHRPVGEEAHPANQANHATGALDAALAGNRSPGLAREAWDAGFERRIRDVASKALAHVKRGDVVVLRTSAGESVRSDPSVGIDPILRFLALLQPAGEELAVDAKPAAAPPTGPVPAPTSGSALGSPVTATSEAG